MIRFRTRTGKPSLREAAAGLRIAARDLYPTCVIQSCCCSR